jgi:signal-transduction protein with cAMP-binding, CBS, and nucleotidyltransferase domain
MKAREVMVKAPVTLPTRATIHEAATAMDRACVGAVVVLDGERPVGLVTDRDLVTRALARRMPLDARVDAVMSTGVVCVDADAELSEVASILAVHPFRRVPVVEQDRMVGMVTLDDLVVRLANDLHSVTKGVAAQLLFGHAEPQTPMTVR